MTKSFSQRYQQEARLIILRALSEQADGRLNSSLIQHVLEQYGITQPRDWVHGELAWLAMMGAVLVSDAGSVKIATITTKGQDHIERKLVIEGVKPPSRPEG